MLWYAVFSKKTSLKNYKKRLRVNRKILYNSCIYLPKNFIKTSGYVVSYVLPTNWTLLIINNSNTSHKYLIFLSNSYYFKVPILTHQILFKYDPFTNHLLISSTYFNNFTQLFFMLLKSFFSTLVKPIFYKLKFKGKGYYIFKNYRNTITPQFGYSHRLYLYAFFSYVRFLSKTSLIVFGLNKRHLNYVSNYIFSWRPLNIFTSRGVRFSRQIVYKKSGKISSYR